MLSGQVVEPTPDEQIRLYHCPFQDLEKKAGLGPASTDAHITDIPYGKEFLDELPMLAELAERTLVEGGIFVTYSGHYHLNTVMRILDKYLTYRWMMASTWDGDASIIHPLGIMSKWKPILIYSKGPWKPTGRFPDVYHVDSKEKEWHPWQQPLDEVERLVRYLTKPGDVVVDCCGGSFTTAVACRNLGRRFVGCDKDEQGILAGQKRLAENAVTSASEIIESTSHHKVLQLSDFPGESGDAETGLAIGKDVPHASCL